MPVAFNAPPATLSKALDAVSADVLAMAAASPRPSSLRLASDIQLRFGLEVSPDNLRMWIARRQADAIRSKVEPAVYSPLDHHLELVNELRDPVRNDGGVYTWPQLLEQLKTLDPTLSAYTVEGLRSWYHRRTSRAKKARVAAAFAIEGRAGLAHSIVGSHSTADGAGVAPPVQAITPEAKDLGAHPPAIVTTPAEEAAPTASHAASADGVAMTADAVAELEKLRGNSSNPLGDLLGKLLPVGPRE